MVKKFITSSIVYAIGPQLPKIAGLFLLPFLTPYLSETDFGVWGTIMAYSLLFSAARDLGMIAPMANTFFKHPTRWKFVWRQIITFLFFFGIVYTLLQIFVLWLVIPKEAVSQQFIILLLISIQSLFFDIPNLIGARSLQLSEKPFALSIISMIGGFSAIAIQLYVVIILKLGYMGWFYAAFFSGLITAICYSIIIIKNRIHPILTFRFRLLKPRLKLSLPMVPHNYSSYLLGSSDRMVMSVTKVSTQDIGFYNVAYLWGNYIDILGNAIGMAVGPMYLKLYAEKSDSAEVKLFHFTQSLQILFLTGPFVISIWSKELFQIFIKNNNLQAMYGLAIVIIMGYSYRPLYWSVVNRLQFHDLTSQLWKISLVGGIINIILNLIFIPIFGYKAAAITTFISLLYIGFSGFYLKEFKRLDSQNHYQIFWIFLIILFTILAYLIKDASLLIKSIVTISSLLISLFYIKWKHINHLTS